MLALQVPAFKIRLTLIIMCSCSILVRSVEGPDPNVLFGTRKYAVIITQLNYGSFTNLP